VPVLYECRPTAASDIELQRTIAPEKVGNISI
jgi:hypothetical protein